MAGAALFASPALAKCGGETLFSCKTRGKQVEVCHDGDKLCFGAQGKPEMQISTKVTELLYRPWGSLRRIMADVVQFTNGEYSYQVWAGVVKNDDSLPQPEWGGGLNIFKGEDAVSYFGCDATSHVYKFNRVLDLKKMAGQCFDHDSQSWKTQCSN